MAGRVNTKFVIVLVAAAVLVLGAGLGLFWKMVSKTGETHAETARAFQAEGNWRLAEESWGRAVGHEKTNIPWLRSWRDAIGQIVPTTKTEYDNLFARYIQISRQIAVTVRSDLEVTEEYLDIRSALFRRMSAGSRSMVEGFVNDVNTMLAYYPEGGPLQRERDRVRRYRGFAWASLAGPGSTLAQSEIDSAIEDLKAAIEAEPSDGESVRALLLLLDTLESRARAGGLRDRVQALTAEKNEWLERLLEADPDDPWGRVMRLELAAEGLKNLPADEREASRAELSARLETLFGWMTERIASVDSRLLERLGILEGLVFPDSKSARAIELYSRAIELLDNRSDLVLQLASLQMQAGEFDEAIRLVRLVEDQPWLPASVEGMLRMRYQMQAPMMYAEFCVRRIAEIDDAEEARELLAQAKDARERFLRQVGVDSPNIPMIDGQIALAEAESAVKEGNNRRALDSYTAALGHFTRYNELTQFNNPEGLWREGRTAMTLNKTGLARQRFEKMLEIDSQNPSVLLALAEVSEMLGTQSSLREAYSYTTRAAGLLPRNDAIQQRLDRLRLLTFQQVSDDPVEAMVFESERLLTGVGGRSPDAMAAEKTLRDGLQKHPGDSRLIRQLVRVLMYSDRLTEARAFIEQAQREHPDNATIDTLARRLAADSMLEIIILGIEESNATELGKLLQKIEVYRRYNEPEKAKEALASAAQMAPGDPDVIEQQFLQALVERRLDDAQRIVAQAETINADKLDGITFRARLLAAQGDHRGSIELLREAVSRRQNESPLWRLLASEQVAAGRINEALESYRRALQITVDDPTTIRAYVATLASSGRTQLALDEARRYREFGERDPAFLDIYIRLEATAGGEEGRRTAINRRRQLLGERPFDRSNKLELADLYIENRQWGEAKKMLDELQSEGEDSLRRVEVLAKWYADQGRVRADDGFRDGIELARGVFINYIVSREASAVGIDAYISMARFMMDRGRDDVAMRAIEEARPLQDPETLRAEKLFGEVMLRRNLPRQAAEAFRRVVESGADEPGQPYRKLLIEMLLRINEFDEAESQIAELGDEHRDDLTVLMQRADIAMMRDRIDEASRIVDRAIQVHPSQPLPFIKRAQLLMPDPNMWRDAQRNLEEALRLAPNDFQAHKLMATMHFRMDRKDEAIRSLRTSLAMNPNQDGVLIGTLIELIESGRDGEALDVANEVINKRSSDATLMLIAGRVFIQREKWGRATVLFERAWRLTKDTRVGLAYIHALLSTTPPKVAEANAVVAEFERLGAKINDDPMILASRAMIEQKNRMSARASSFLTRAFEQSVGNPGLTMQWFGEVKRVFDGGDTGEAVRYMAGLRDQMPQGTEQREWLEYGTALLRVQDEIEIEAAERDLQRLKSGAENVIIRRLAHRLLGSGRYNRDDFAGAAEAWRDGIEAFEDDWEMHNNLAYCIGVDLGRPSEGVPLARQAALLADARADVYDTLGKLLLLSGELDEAEEALLAARERLRTERERVNVLLNLARLSLARGKVDEAVRLWTQADTTVYTLPDLRDVVQKDLDDVKGQIDSARGSG